MLVKIALKSIELLLRGAWHQPYVKLTVGAGNRKQWQGGRKQGGQRGRLKGGHWDGPTLAMCYPLPAPCLLTRPPHLPLFPLVHYVHLLSLSIN